MTTSRSDSAGKKKDKYERYKIASIPILLLVLVYVLMNPDDNQQVFVAEAAMTTSIVANSSSNNNNANDNKPLPTLHSSPSNTQRETKAKSGWPDIDVDFAAATDAQTNPFARIGVDRSYSPAHPTAGPEAPPPAANEAERISELARELARQPVKYVFKSAESRFVMLGEQVYQEGQTIAPTIQLQGIDENNLLIGPLDKATHPPEVSSQSTIE